MGVEWRWIAVAADEVMVGEIVAGAGEIAAAVGVIVAAAAVAGIVAAAARIAIGAGGIFAAAMEDSEEVWVGGFVTGVTLTGGNDMDVATLGRMDGRKENGNAAKGSVEFLISGAETNADFGVSETEAAGQLGVLSSDSDRPRDEGTTTVASASLIEEHVLVPRRGAKRANAGVDFALASTTLFGTDFVSPSALGHECRGLSPTCAGRAAGV